MLQPLDPSTRSAPRARFSQAPIAAGRRLRAAQGVFNWLERSGLGKSDWRKGNLSLQDFASRTSLLFSWYVPQTIISIRHKTHPWENFGRNLTVFLVTLGVLSYTKSDRFSLNTLLFDRFMKPARLGGDYFELLKAAGIDFWEKDRKRPFWTKLDDNQIAKLDDFIQKIAPGASAEGLLPWEQRVLGKFSDADKLRLHTMGKKFLNRLNGMRLASTGIIIVAMALLVGQLAMEFVFRTFARLDKDFDPQEFKQRHLDLKRPAAATSSLEPSRVLSLPAPLMTPVSASSGPRPVSARPVMAASAPQPATAPWAYGPMPTYGGGAYGQAPQTVWSWPPPSAPSINSFAPPAMPRGPQP